MRRRAADEQVSDRWAVVHFVERADGVVSRQARLVIVGSQMRQAVVKAGLIAAGYGGQFAEGGVAWANQTTPRAEPVTCASMPMAWFVSSFSHL